MFLKSDVMVSTFPPQRCGIGTYALQSLTKRRAEGRPVRRVALGGRGRADYNWDINNTKSTLGLLRYLLVRPIEVTEVQFVDGFFIFAGGRGAALRAFLILLTFLLFRLKSKKFIMVVHEVELNLKKLHLNLFRTLLMMTVEEFVFHTKKELVSFKKIFPFISEKRLILKDHSEDFILFYNEGKQSARLELGLSQTETIFLCIGFLQAHKQFDVAMRAFSEAAPKDSKLYVVGSCREEISEFLAYRDKLMLLQTENTKLVYGYLDDRAFDLWISAADYLILPYREIWSSGVGARAGMLGTKLIARALPSLVDQLNSTDTDFFETDSELTTLIQSKLKAPMEGGK